MSWVIFWMENGSKGKRAWKHEQKMFSKWEWGRCLVSKGRNHSLLVMEGTFRTCPFSPSFQRGRGPALLNRPWPLPFSTLQILWLSLSQPLSHLYKVRSVMWIPVGWLPHSPMWAHLWFCWGARGHRRQVLSSEGRILWGLKGISSAEHGFTDRGALSLKRHLPSVLRWT